MHNRNSDIIKGMRVQLTKEDKDYARRNNISLADMSDFVSDQVMEDEVMRSWEIIKNRDAFDFSHTQFFPRKYHRRKEL